MDTRQLSGDEDEITPDELARALAEFEEELRKRDRRSKMYQRDHWVGGDARQQASLKLFGPDWPHELCVRIESLELWCTTIKDPGEDYCKWRGFDDAGELIATKRVDGY